MSEKNESKQADSKNGSTKEKKEKKAKKKGNSNLKIMEWRFNQFLGEKLTYQQIKEDPENESFLVTDIKFSGDGENVAVSDKGGRVIIFKKTDSKKGIPKLEYYYEFPAQEKDFDAQRSIEYTEEIKALEIMPSSNYKKIDILTAGYRTIKLDRIYQDQIPKFEDIEKDDIIPKFISSTPEVKNTTKKQFLSNNSGEINSLSVNKENPCNFISSDEYKVYLWDINYSQKDLYTPVDIDPMNESTTAERITKSAYIDYDPHIFIYGTSNGNIRVCDLRIGSEQLKFETTYKDEKSDMNSAIANSLLSVHDISTVLSNKYSFATRHYFSINLWDMRKQNSPTCKFLTYEPIINKLSYLYQNNYINDKFSLSTDNTGKFILTGGYNNMFHVIDTEQRLNTQIVIDDSNEKTMNTNVIRKINAKGSCFYKKDDQSINNINFDKKITHQIYSPIENYSLLIVYNCIYSYSGRVLDDYNNLHQ
jgi:serine/threonine-protein phosphatase 2A regulatory subunit B